MDSITYDDTTGRYNTGRPFSILAVGIDSIQFYDTAVKDNTGY